MMLPYLNQGSTDARLGKSHTRAPRKMLRAPCGCAMPIARPAPLAHANMLATVFSAALQGIDAVPVQVEVNYGEAGEPRLILVGLPDAAVKESDDRVFSALANSGMHPRYSPSPINNGYVMPGFPTIETCKDKQKGPDCSGPVRFP